MEIKYTDTYEQYYTRGDGGYNRDKEVEISKPILTTKGHEYHNLVGLREDDKEDVVKELRDKLGEDAKFDLINLDHEGFLLKIDKDIREDEKVEADDDIRLVSRPIHYSDGFVYHLCFSKEEDLKKQVEQFNEENRYPGGGKKEIVSKMEDGIFVVKTTEFSTH